MRHIERHTYVLEFNKELINYKGLHEELALLSEAWPNADIEHNATDGTVSVSYENFSACRSLAEECATMFRNAVNRHNWWEEV